MWVLCLDQEDPLEEDMATHSSILAWGIPWTGSLAGRLREVCSRLCTAHAHAKEEVYKRQE